MGTAVYASLITDHEALLAIAKVLMNCNLRTTADTLFFLEALQLR